MTVQALTPEISEALELSSRKGVLVADVVKGSPAAEAGIQQGDVIVSIADKPVTDPSALQFLVSEIAPGTRTRIALVRGGKRMEVTAAIGDLSKAEEPEETFVVEDNRFLQGAVVTDLSPMLRDSLGVPNTVDGVVVAGVERNSAAAGTGLRKGDVILAINGKQTTGLSEFKQAVQALHGRKMEMSIYRQGMVMNLTIIR